MKRKNNKLALKEYKTRHDWKGDPQRIAQETKIQPYYQLANYKSKTVQENGTCESFRNFEIQTDHLLLAKRSDLIFINKKTKC